MAKEVLVVAKVELPGGGANQALVGKSMGPYGINLTKFCTEFNAKTKEKSGIPCPAVVAIYKDKSFSIEVKTPPTAFLIRNAMSIQKGLSNPGKDSPLSISREKVLKIAEEKAIDCNSLEIESIVKSVEGTARSMGIKVI
jgi:large subunit ribosomal protein L11